MQSSNDIVSGGSDGGTISRGRVAARAGPAPVLSEASTRRRREHSRQASMDMAARLGGYGNDNGERAYEQTASYMAQTESSLRHASIGSETSITGSVRRILARRSADRNDDASDVASVASSQWSMRRRRVGPRPAQFVERPVPVTTTERAQRIAARTAAQRVANSGGAAPDDAADANCTRLPVNSVVVRGGVRVSALRRSSLAASDDGSHNLQAAQRLNLSASAAASPTLTTVTVSDDDTGELTKSGVSVSLSPITSGARSGRKSLHNTRHGSSSGAKGGPDFLSPADGEGTGDELDGQAEPVPRTTQPISFDGCTGANRSVLAAAGQGRGAMTTTGPEKGGRPPLTPHGDASPRPGGGVGQRTSSLGGAAPMPATTLISNTVQRHSSSFDYLQQQRCGSFGGAAAPARGANAGNGTTTHRVAEGRRSGSDYDAVGRQSIGEDSIDDTPISVLKERANREAERNARRDAEQPVIPRLALGEITAKRDLPHRSAAYRVAHDGAMSYVLDTPVTGGSVLSDVTVSSMTDSATPHVHGVIRSGRGHPAEPRLTAGEDVRVGRLPSASAVLPVQCADATTYDSQSVSLPREEAAVSSSARVSPPHNTVNRRDGDGNGGAAATTVTTTTTSTGTDARTATKSNAVPASGGVKVGAMKAAPPPGAETTAGGEKPASKPAEDSKRRTSPSLAAPGTAASAPTQGGAGEPKKHHKLEKCNATATKPAPPLAASTKETTKCCAIM